jgi:predicted SprT family Zn-dependent metalloprotease
MARGRDRLEHIKIVFRELNRKYFRSAIPMPAFRLSTRMRVSAGCVEYRQGRHLVSLSIPYHDYFGWDGELRSTLKHEMVHLYLGRYRGIQGHGREFLDVCRSIGTERYCKVLPFPRLQYLYHCPHCGTHYVYRKRVRLYCGRCYGEKPRIWHPLHLLRTRSGKAQGDEGMRRPPRGSRAEGHKALTR